jgi:mevalonate kinase
LMANVAAWAGVDAFDLLAATWGGSGYDVACGQAGGPILYQRLHGRSQWVEIPFRPAFSEQLWFVYLGQKQDSREGIHRYRERSERITSSKLDEIGALTLAAAAAVQLTDFEKIMTEHERTIGSLLGLEPVQQSRFSDYPGVVKSLGAWGGDFVLVTGAGTADATKAYFAKKGLDTVLGYGELIV